MNRVVLQVPVDYQVRRDAEEGALAQGFWSLQDAVRLFLNQLAKRTISITFQSKGEGFVTTGKYKK